MLSQEMEPSHQLYVVDPSGCFRASNNVLVMTEGRAGSSSNPELIF